MNYSIHTYFENIREFSLPNGMKVILKKDEELPTVHYQLWIKCGSIHEGAYLGTGISHFIEHSIFLGSKKYPKRGEYSSLIEKRGGADNNAHTGFEHTAYHFTLDRKYFHDGLDILSDLVRRPLFPRLRVAKEKKVILAEMDMENDDVEMMIGQSFNERVFADHPYGLPIIGYRDLFKKLSRKDLIAFHREMYQPQNSVLVLGGDIDFDEAGVAVEKYFNAWEANHDSKNRLVKIPGSGVRVNKDIIEYHEVEKARLKLGWKTCSLLSPDMAAMDLLDSLLGDGKSSFLHQTYVESGKCFQIETSSWTPGDVGNFEIQVIASKKIELKWAQEIPLAIHSYVASLTQKQCEAAKKKIYQDVIHSLESTSGLCHNLASNHVYANDISFDIHYLDQINAVTVEKIKEVVTKYIQPERMVHAAYLPKGMSGAGLKWPTLPSKPKLMVKAEKKKKQKNETPVFKRINGQDGMKVVLKERTSELVYASLVFRGGLEWEDAKKHGKYHLLSRMLMEGTRRKSASEITYAFENEGNLIVPFSSESAYGLTFSFFKKDQKKIYSILSELINDSVFPLDRLKKVKSKIADEISLDNENIWEEHRKLFRRSLFPGSILSEDVRGSEKSLKNISAKDLLEIHASQSVKGNASLCLIGQVNEGFLMSMLKRLPRGESKEKVETDWRREVPLKRIVKKSLERDQTIYRMAYWGASFDSEDVPYLDLLSFYFSGLGGPLFRLREITGDAYQISCSHTARRTYGVFVFTVALAAHSKRTETWFIKNILSMIKKVRDKKVSLAEIERAVASAKGAKAMSMQAYGEQSAQVALYELFGLGYEAFLKETEYENEDPKHLLDRLSEMVVKYFRDDHYLVVGAGANAL